MNQAEINNLLDRYLGGQCTAEEERRIEKWLDQDLNEVNEWTLLSPEEKKTFLASLYRDIEKKIHGARIISMKLRRRLWIAAAVFFFFVAGGGIYLAFFNKITEKGTARQSVPDVRFKNDVAAPGVSRATLQLADGRIVYLDSAQSGSVAMEGNVKVVKTADDQLRYEVNSAGGGAADAAVRYNTVSNPRGSKAISLALADGTQVWLNAESSITYPTAFAGKERRVEMRGEAYFSAAHDPDKPFIVKKGAIEVRVLGTEFNVNTYEDESSIAVTLVRGAVRVNSGKRVQTLTPGQQARVDRAGDIRLVRDADIDEVIAWKNGLFQFKEADIETVMRQVARWYDVQVVYQGKPNIHFGGKIDRNSTLVQMFNILETSGAHFSIDGKKVTVLP